MLSLTGLLTGNDPGAGGEAIDAEGNRSRGKGAGWYSFNRTFAARRSTIVACCSALVACRVAITDGITQQNVQRNPPGTLPRHDPVNGYRFFFMISYWEALHEFGSDVVECRRVAFPDGESADCDNIFRCSTWLVEVMVPVRAEVPHARCPYF